MAQASSIEKLKKHLKRLKKNKKEKEYTETTDQSKFAVLQWDIDKGLTLTGYRLDQYIELKKKFGKGENDGN